MVSFPFGKMGVQVNCPRRRALPTLSHAHTSSISFFYRGETRSILLLRKISALFGQPSLVLVNSNARNFYCICHFAELACSMLVKLRGRLLSPTSLVEFIPRASIFLHHCGKASLFELLSTLARDSSSAQVSRFEAISRSDSVLTDSLSSHPILLRPPWAFCFPSFISNPEDTPHATSSLLPLARPVYAETLFAIISSKLDPRPWYVLATLCFELTSPSYFLNSLHIRLLFLMAPQQQIACT